MIRFVRWARSLAGLILILKVSQQMMYMTMDGRGPTHDAGSKKGLSLIKAQAAVWGGRPTRRGE